MGLVLSTWWRGGCAVVIIGLIVRGLSSHITNYIANSSCMDGNRTMRHLPDYPANRQKHPAAFAHLRYFQRRCSWFSHPSSCIQVVAPQNTCTQRRLLVKPAADGLKLNRPFVHCLYAHFSSGCAAVLDDDNPFRIFLKYRNLVVTRQNRSVQSCR